MREVNDVSSSKCPVSLIDSETHSILNFIHRATHAKASILGSDLSSYPIWLVDALQIVGQCQIQLDNLSGMTTK